MPRAASRSVHPCASAKVRTRARVQGVPKNMCGRRGAPQSEHCEVFARLRRRHDVDDSRQLLDGLVWPAYHESARNTRTRRLVGGQIAATAAGQLGSPNACGRAEQGWVRPLAWAGGQVECAHWIRMPSKPLRSAKVRTGGRIVTCIWYSHGGPRFS